MKENLFNARVHLKVKFWRKVLNVVLNIVGYLFTWLIYPVFWLHAFFFPKHFKQCYIEGILRLNKGLSLEDAGKLYLLNMKHFGLRVWK